MTRPFDFGFGMGLATTSVEVSFGRAPAEGDEGPDSLVYSLIEGLGRRLVDPDGAAKLA